MTTAVFARAGRMADQVREESRRLDPVKALLTLAFVLPFALGWLAAGICRALWVIVAWAWTALVVGWRTAWPRAERV